MFLMYGERFVRTLKYLAIASIYIYKKNMENIKQVYMHKKDLQIIIILKEECLLQHY